MIALRRCRRPVAVLLPLLLLLAGPPLAAQEKNQSAVDVEAKLLKGAEDGNAKMQLELGIAYLTGKHDIKIEPKKALHWFQRAAAPRKGESGTGEVRNARALLYLGLCYDEYYQQIGLKQDKQEALKHYLLAVEHGLPQANHYVAFTYRALGQDDQAATYFRAAADLGNQVCQIEYGKALLEGRSVPKEPLAGQKYLLLAAQGGSPEASLLLAECYAGNHPPIPADPQKMIDSLWAASTNSPAAMTRIGYCYENGIGLAHDPVLATKWYAKAVAGGDANAMVNLAACYSAGRGVPADPERAFKLYTQAATTEPPLALALHNLGICHATGKGTPRNDQAAVKLFERAAALNFPRASFELGLWAAEGRLPAAAGQPLPADPAVAFQHFRRAADLGYGPAWLKLGTAYRNGLGVAADQAQAKAAFAKAKELGEAAAEQALKELF